MYLLGELINTKKSFPFCLPYKFMSVKNQTPNESLADCNSSIFSRFCSFPKSRRLFVEEKKSGIVS